MRRHWMGLLVLVFAARGAEGLSLEAELRATAGVHGAHDARFSPASQFRWSAGALFEMTADIGLGGGFAVEIESALASPVVDLVSYRGYFGPRITAFAVWWSRSAPVALGLRLGVLGAFLRYTATESYFVTPGVLLEPSLRLSLQAVPWLTLGLSLPLVLTRRADLVFSGEISLALDVGATLRLPVKP